MWLYSYLATYMFHSSFDQLLAFQFSDHFVVEDETLVCSVLCTVGYALQFYTLAFQMESVNSNLVAAI